MCLPPMASRYDGRYSICIAESSPGPRGVYRDAVRAVVDLHSLAIRVGVACGPHRIAAYRFPAVLAETIPDRLVFRGKLALCHPLAKHALVYWLPTHVGLLCRLCRDYTQQREEPRYPHDPGLRVEPIRERVCRPDDPYRLELGPPGILTMQPPESVHDSGQGEPGRADRIGDEEKLIEHYIGAGAEAFVLVPDSLPDAVPNFLGVGGREVRARIVVKTLPEVAVYFSADNL